MISIHTQQAHISGLDSAASGGGGVEMGDFDVSLAGGVITSTVVRIQFELESPVGSVLSGATKFMLCNFNATTQYSAYCRTASSTAISSAGVNTTSIKVDTVAQTLNRLNLWNAIMLTPDKKVIEVVATITSGWSIQPANYPDDVFRLKSGILSNFKVDVGNTGTFDHHFELSSSSDTTDQIGSGVLTIAAR